MGNEERGASIEAPISRGLKADEFATEGLLPVGTRMGEFEILDVIGIGGFGIVYLGQDHSLKRRVAIKEYMPTAIAIRREGGLIGPKAKAYAGAFEAGLRSFMNEAQMLARFDHPALVKVYRFWEANGTAFMVMPYYEGKTLKETLQALPARPKQDWLLRMLAPILDALEIIHRENVFHRDIAPDNILILPDGSPVLLDFGAARQVINGMTSALTVILKPGYAPIEQYAESSGLQQGPQTDIYAISAVIYFAITGQVPPPSVSRVVNDGLRFPSTLAESGYSAALLDALKRGLAVRPENRPVTVAEFRTMLGLSRSVGTGAHPERGLDEHRSGQHAGRRIKLPSVLAILAAGAIAWVLIATLGPSRESAQAVPVKTEAVQERALSPQELIDRIYEGRSRDRTVSVLLDKARVKIGQDSLGFRVVSSSDGYLYLLMVGTDGHFYRLFPNEIDGENGVQAGEEMVLPRNGWRMVAGGPPGTNHFIVIVSDRPRVYEVARSASVRMFEEVVRSVDRGVSEQVAAVLGSVACKGVINECSQAYGASAFVIQEEP